MGGETALFKVSLNGHTDVVEQLLRWDADPNETNDSKPWPTHTKRDMAIWLLDMEEEPKNQYGLWPLYAAAKRGYEDIVARLLEHGAEVDGKRDGGETPLYAGAKKNHADVVRLLLKSGAEIQPLETVDPVRELLRRENKAKLERKSCSSEKNSGEQKTQTKNKRTAKDPLVDALQHLWLYTNGRSMQRAGGKAERNVIKNFLSFAVLA